MRIGKVLDRNINRVSAQHGREGNYQRGDDISDFPIEEARFKGIYTLLVASAVTTAGYGISLMEHAVSRPTTDAFHTTDSATYTEY